MSEDVVVVNRPEDRISTLPGTYLEALSAIQEQAFVESNLDDPDYYGEIFTLKHRLAFFKTGLFAGLHDSVITLIGMILFVLAEQKALPCFDYSHSRWNFFLAFAITTFPYLATLVLTIRTFAHINGTISKKMAFYLAAGFAEGSVFSTCLVFALCWAIATEWCNQMYEYLYNLGRSMSFLEGIEDFFWYSLRPALMKASWDELKISVVVSLCLLFAYFSRKFWIARKEKI